MPCRCLRNSLLIILTFVIGLTSSSLSAAPSCREEAEAAIRAAARDRAKEVLNDQFINTLCNGGRLSELRANLQTLKDTADSILPELERVIVFGNAIDRELVFLNAMFERSIATLGDCVTTTDYLKVLRCEGAKAMFDGALLGKPRVVDPAPVPPFTSPGNTFPNQLRSLDAAYNSPKGVQ